MKECLPLPKYRRTSVDPALNLARRQQRNSSTSLSSYLMQDTARRSTSATSDVHNAWRSLMHT
jgi:hypothetical protein